MLEDCDQKGEIHTDGIKLSEREDKMLEDCDLGGKTHSED